MTYITRSSKDNASNLTSARGFRGGITLTEDILVKLSILGSILIILKPVSGPTHAKKITWSAFLSKESSNGGHITRLRLSLGHSLHR